MDGIPEHYRERIFEPDFTTKERGNGLGLWLISNHLEHIEGAINVKSAPGEGTTFTIVIPLSKESELRGGNDERNG
jgi:two-component system NtrC family sensor kinase